MSGETWAAWRAVLMAAWGEPLEADELEIFQRLSGRQAPPVKRVEEFWGVVGRRGGKSRSMSTLAAYIGGLCDHSDALSPGERGVVTLIAPDQRQSRILLDYAEGAFLASPILKQLIDGRTSDTLSLTTGIDLEVRSCVVPQAARCDECRRAGGRGGVLALGRDRANPDVEILNAVRPIACDDEGAVDRHRLAVCEEGRGLEHLFEAFRREGRPVHSGCAWDEPGPEPGARTRR